VVLRLRALFPPRSSVLPPGAGNEEAKKALEAGKKRAKAAEGYRGDVASVDGQVHAAPVTRQCDGNGTAVEPIETRQDISGSPRGGSAGSAQS